MGEDLWDVVNGSNTSPPDDGPKNSSAYKKWKQVNAKAEFILKRTVSSDLFDHIIKCKSAHEIWRTLDHLFNKKNEARLQILENELASTTQAILRPAIGLDQILEANEENGDQIDREADLEGQISGETIDDITFEISKADKHIIEELERKYDGVSYYSVEASQEIDDNIITESNEEANTNEISQYYGVASEEACSKILSIKVPNLSIIDVSLDSTTAGKLRERGSLGTQRRDNSHGSFDNGKSLSFDEARRVRKKLLRSSPRRGSKLRLSSSTTSVG
ncbi:hypothetical protein KY284_009740 [Solanum tuberosum]|nr:hypothetical protein KY284_009740 [Solanum tuberosum]